jgi:SAM-dependent methyltransferase
VASTLNKIGQIRRRPEILMDIFHEKIYGRKYTAEIDSFLSHMKSLPYDANSSDKIKLNKLCCLEDWENNEMKQTILELQKFGAIGGTLRHRKDWEWALGIIAMQKLGKLNKGSVAVGVGAGKEAVLFYLAKYIKHVFATDLYGGGSWAEAPVDFPANPRKYSPSNYEENALTVLRMDGTKLEFPTDNFDIAFSFSSIEHFGGVNHGGALQALKEIERVLKPGGIAIVATEYVINGKAHEEFFNSDTIYSDLLTKLTNLQLVEPLDLSISPKTLDTVLDYFSTGLNWQKLSEEQKEACPHILLKRKNLLWTSIMLVFEKMR